MQSQSADYLYSNRGSAGHQPTYRGLTHCTKSPSLLEQTLNTKSKRTNEYYAAPTIGAIRRRKTAHAVRAVSGATNIDVAATNDSPIWPFGRHLVLARITVLYFTYGFISANLLYMFGVNHFRCPPTSTSLVRQEQAPVSTVQARIFHPGSFQRTFPREPCSIIRGHIVQIVNLISILGCHRS